MDTMGAAASVVELLGIGVLCVALVLLVLGLNFGFATTPLMAIYGIEGALLIRASFVFAGLALIGFVIFVANDAFPSADD